MRTRTTPRLTTGPEIEAQLGRQAGVGTGGAVLCDSNKNYLCTALPQAEPPQDDQMTPQVQLQSFISVR